MQGVQEALSRAGYRGECAETLRPGAQRLEFVAWAISSLLGGGKSVDALWPQLVAGRACSDAAGGDQLLSEEERLAQRYKQVLGLLGIKTSVDDIRGCGDKGAADLLLRLAELVVAVKEQQAGGGGGGSSGAAASQALLDAACDAGPRLWSDALQLFPRDMAPLLEEYADVADQVPATLQELRQRLAQEAGGGEAEAPSAAAWARDSAALSAAVAEAMDAGTQLRGVFQQELSVWAEEDAAEASGRQQHGGGGSGGGTDVGAAATKALAGYQDVNGLIEAMGLLMDMHGTLQDVPVEWLNDLAASQAAAAAELAEGAAVLLRSGGVSGGGGSSGV